MNEFLRRLRFVFTRARFERELDEEMRHHLALKAEQGSPANFGNITSLKEDSRTMWTFAFWEQLAQDIRYGLRAMAANKLFTAMAALSLALGIGANIAIYSFMNAIMLRALPVQHPENLVVLNWRAKDQPAVIHRFSGGGYKDPKTGFTSGRYPYPAFELLRSQSDSAVDLFAFDDTGRGNVLFNGQADLAKGQFVSGDYFSILGVLPAAGRLIGEQDDRAGAQPVVVLADAYWRSRFAANPGVVGKTVVINNVQYVVVGVAAPGFRGADPSTEAAFFLPLHFVPDEARLTNPNYYWLRIMGRLRPGHDIVHASASLAGIFNRFVTATASTARERADLPALSLQEGGSGVDSLRRRYSEPLLVLMTMVGLILTIACANIASLLLSRASARRREFAVRLSLGASRMRIVRQLLTESLLLSCAGGVLAFAIALPGMRLIAWLLAGGGNQDLHVALDANVFAFTVVLAFASGIALGLVPALQATQIDVAPALKATRAGTARRRRIGIGHALVLSQIALSFLLVFGAELFVRTLSNLESVELGFDRENVLLLSVMAGQAGYKGDALTRLYENLRTRFQAMPGVRGATFSDLALVSGSMSAGGIVIPGISTIDGASPGASFMRVGPGFFTTMRIPILLGREIGQGDGPASPPVAVVNEVFVRKYFGRDNPLGRTFRLGTSEVVIVGVAKTARYDTLKRDVPPIAYFASSQQPKVLNQAVYEIRTAGDPVRFAQSARRIVADLAPRVPVFNMTTQSAQIDETIGQERTFADLCTAFAALALIIACVGLFGLMAYAVSRRTNEIGIRMALGAERGRIIGMVLREAIGLAAAGLAIGLVCAWASASAVKSFLFGMKPADPIALVTSVIVLAAAAIIAGYAPAWRASRIDPMAALRHE